MKKPIFLIIFLISGSCLLYAREQKVNTISTLVQVIKNAQPGDRIIVTNGRYTTTESILVRCSGTDGHPITVEAETTGGVEITGSYGFLLSPPASFIVIRGFRFTHKTGTSCIEPGVTHCLITRNVFECTPAGSSGSHPYLNISGDDNEISYNTFQNKKDEGQMISIQGPGGDKMAKRTWIHHNYFFGFPPTANNCSAIQIGLSGRSMDSAFCIVEYNLFERTEGENEGAICHKSCNNIIRFNTFGERSEELSLRHGNNSQVYGNFFINTAGLRFSGDDHLIYRNYFQECSKAIVCTNGDGEVKEGSKLTCHDRPDRVKVVFNTIISCNSSYQMPERNNGLGATEITFSNNMISGGEPVSIRGNYPDPVWKDNILRNASGGSMPPDGYVISNQDLVIDKHGVYHMPESNLKSMDKKYPVIPATNRSLTIADVGSNSTSGLEP